MVLKRVWICIFCIKAVVVNYLLTIVDCTLVKHLMENVVLEAQADIAVMHI